MVRGPEDHPVAPQNRRSTSDNNPPSEPQSSKRLTVISYYQNVTFVFVCEQLESYKSSVVRENTRESLGDAKKKIFSISSE